MNQDILTLISGLKSLIKTRDNLNQRRICKQAGISETFLSQILSGNVNKNFTAQALSDILDAAGISLMEALAEGHRMLQGPEALEAILDRRDPDYLLKEVDRLKGTVSSMEDQLRQILLAVQRSTPSKTDGQELTPGSAKKTG